jgi:hypothetical protein
VISQIVLYFYFRKIYYSNLKEHHSIFGKDNRMRSSNVIVENATKGAAYGGLFGSSLGMSPAEYRPWGRRMQIL